MSTPRRGFLIAGALTAMLAVVPPVDAAADTSLAAHMAQHLLLAVLAPALVAAGAPIRALLRSLLRAPTVRALRSGPVRALGHPLVALALAAVTLLAIHLPVALDAAERHPALHAALHVALFCGALPLWMLIVAVDPLPHRPGPLGAAALVLAGQVPMAALAMWMQVSTRPRYATYPTVGAQRDAASLMAAVGGLITATVLVAATMTALVAQERRQRHREARR